MVRVLTVDETQAFLANHPEIRADDIPSYGLRVDDSGKNYLVGLDHNTGQVKVIDITAYNDYWFGQEAIDPTSPGVNWDDVYNEAVKPALQFGGAVLNLLILGAGVWLVSKFSK